jgi:hypothetical protein
MSALPPKADIAGRELDVRFVPKADVHLAAGPSIPGCTNEHDRPRSSFGQPCLPQAFEEPSLISWSCERPNKVLIAHGQSRHAMQ